MTDLFDQFKNSIIKPVSLGPFNLISDEATLKFISTDMLKVGFLIWEPGNGTVYLSDRIVQNYNYFLLKDLINYSVDTEGKSFLTKKFRNLFFYPDTISLEVKLKPGNPGSIYWINIILRSEFFKNGKIKKISGIIEDISEQKTTEEKAVKLLRIKDALLEVNHHMATIGDLDKLIQLILIRISESISHVDCASFLVLTEDNYFTMSTSIGYDPESAKQFKLPYNELFFKKVKAKEYTTPMIVNDVHKIENIGTPLAKTRGGIRIKSLINAPIVIDNKLIGIISLDSSHNNIFDKVDLEIMQYIKEQIEIAISKYKLYEKIKFLSRHDQLTGFINRSYFEELFDQNIKLAKRYNRSLSLAVIDLDRLKTVNDNFGHLAGDTLIMTFSKKLKSYFRDSDIFSRFGGDEFVALFVSIEKDKLEKKFVEFTKNLREEPIIFKKDKIVCSFSYGLSSYPDEGSTFTDLFKLADTRMYRLKESKR